MNRRCSALPMIVLACAALAAPAALAAAEVNPTERSAGYREGQRALEDERWDEAARAFAALIRSDSPEADAALYWKAYADSKAQRKKAALEGVRRLLSEYPESRWVDDARVLEQEIRAGKGPKVRTEQDDDEELKLQALEGLLQMEPEQAVPVLERLLSGSSSLRLKGRALFVLSQYDSPRAREVVLRVARSAGPMELRTEAVRTLGISGEPEDIAALGAILRQDSVPEELREAVIEAYLIADRTDELAALARSDGNVRVRDKAIEALAAIGALPALQQLWSSEKDPGLRLKLLQAFGVAGDVDTLARIARESTEPELRHRAIEGLGVTGDEDAVKVLRELYARFSDPADKRKVLDGFLVSGDAKMLVELFRAEKDPAMKRSILQTLTVMGDPEATRVILDILGEKQ